MQASSSDAQARISQLRTTVLTNQTHSLVSQRKCIRRRQLQTSLQVLARLRWQASAGCYASLEKLVVFRVNDEVLPLQIYR